MNWVGGDVALFTQGNPGPKVTGEAVNGGIEYVKADITLQWPSLRGRPRAMP